MRLQTFGCNKAQSGGVMLIRSPSLLIWEVSSQFLAWRSAQLQDMRELFGRREFILVSVMTITAGITLVIW